MGKSLAFYWYPKCGTCRKARKWLEEHKISFKAVHLIDETPEEETIHRWMSISGLAPRKFFNTSGQKYRELGLRDKLAQMTEDDMVRLLASDGMLIKRPVVTDGKRVTVGFNEQEFEEVWGA